MSLPPTWASSGYEDDFVLPDSIEHARIRGHDAFDRIWKSALTHRGQKRARWMCYAWLADQLGIHRDDCHFKRFDIEMCGMAVKVCEGVSLDDIWRWAKGRTFE